jgi:flagellin
MRINQNIMAFNAYRNLSGTNTVMGKSLEKLSSGFRINRAADDAAGLVISQGLRAQVSGLRQATRNAQDGVSVVQTAEGALNEVHSMLNRMRDLAVQAANTGTNDTAARTAAQAEVNQLSAEITRITDTTKFGGQALLNGSFGLTAGQRTGYDNDNSITVAGGSTFTVAVAGGSGALTVSLTAGTYTGAQFAALAQNSARAVLAASSDAVDQAAANNFSVSAVTVGTGSAVTFENMGSAIITIADGTNTPLAGFDVDPIGTVAAASGSGGVFQVGAGATDTLTISLVDMDATTLGVASLDLVNSASAAISAVDLAITTVSSTRGTLGAYQNRFESTIANLQVATENLAASESRIRDTDYALEMVTYTRHSILQQAGTAMLAQANQVPQSVLSLLR